MTQHLLGFRRVWMCKRKEGEGKRKKKLTLRLGLGTAAVGKKEARKTNRTFPRGTEGRWRCR